jgi:HlyD family secretion protein
MKKVLWVMVAGVVAAGIWWGWREKDKAPEPRPDRGGGRRSAKVELRDIAVVVESVGEINAANQVTVKPEVSGKIREVAVSVGQTVKRGDLLLALDDADLLSEQAAAKTEIEGTQLQLTKARRDLERLKDLFASQLVSQETFENAKTAADLAANDLERSQRRLQIIEDKLSKVRILAPFDGTVLTLPVSPGQVVSGATSVSQGTELMTFANLNELVIRSHVSQVDIAKILVGQAAEITVDSLPNVTLTGRVILIAPVATVKSGIKGFSVDVLITHPDPRIRPGMNANLRFPIAEATQVPAVPVSAVFSEGTNKVIYVRAGPQTERRVVTLGVTDYNYCEVKTGVTPGETVALEKPAAAS